MNFILFLGLVEFYSKFEEKCSEKTHEMPVLLRKKSRFEWSRACQRLVLDIKQAIHKAPTLKGFHPTMETFVTKDAREVWGVYSLTRVNMGMKV